MANASADHNVSNRESHATRLEIDRKPITPKCAYRIYTEIRTECNGSIKTLALGKYRTLSTFPPPRPRRLKKFYQGLLRREVDERTVQRRVGKPGVDNASLVTEGFIRTDTRGSSSSARRSNLHQEAGYIYADCPFAPTSNLLQSGGGPYNIISFRSRRCSVSDSSFRFRTKTVLRDRLERVFLSK